jgi:hypothetical protein
MDQIKAELRRLVEMDLHEKVFSSGSRGYLAMGKVTIDDKRYMINIQAVEIGSKNK